MSGSLVELGIQRKHAAIRIFKLVVQTCEVLLTQTQFLQASQQVAILFLDFRVGLVRARPRQLFAYVAQTVAQRRDSLPRQRLEHADRGATPDVRIDVEAIHEASRGYQTETRTGPG